MKLKIIKIVSFFSLLAILITNISPVLAFCFNDSQVIKLEKDHECISVLKFKGKDMLKGIAYVVYRDPATGRKQPAFCVEPQKQGVGTGAGDSYDVTLNLLNDPRLWRALYKGYMGKNYQAYGLECDDDFYYATKTAVHCLCDGSTPKEKYEIPHRVGRGENASLEDVQRRGARVLDVAQELYDYAINGTENYTHASVTAKKNGQEKIQLIDGVKYLVQSFSVSGNRGLDTYKVSIFNFPEGTKILNNNNQETNNMSNSIFKIAVPTKSIKNNQTGIINIIDAQVKTYPVFYATAYDEKFQNYITYADPLESASNKLIMDIDAYKSGIRVVKVDSETNEPLSNVKFNVKYTDTNEKIGDFTTNNKGQFEVKNLRQGKVTLTELSTQEEYILDTKPINADMEYEQIKEIRIENKHKKGNLKVIKIDKDNNEILIPDVEFELLDNDKKVVGKYKTDKNGELTIQGLRTGDYILRETKANENYYPLDKDVVVTIKWNETTKKVIENEKKKGKIKVIKVDKDNNEVKLKDVVFDVKDKNNKVIETLITDKNGEAITKDLPIDQKYTLVERKTQKEYVLLEEVKVVELKEDEITTVKFENEKIKGKVEINKIDSKTKEKLEGAKFGIYNDKNELVEKITTDKEGKATSNLLPIGKYYLKELETGSKYYLLNEQTYEFEIVKNGETIEKEIENEPVEIIVDVDKKGTIEIKPGDNVTYEFSNIANNSNIYLDNFKWYDYIPTDYVRANIIETGTYNQDLKYKVYVKTNKDGNYKLFKENLDTKENYILNLNEIQLLEDEYITEFYFDFGKVEKEFREVEKPRLICKSLDTLKNNDTFTNHTKTVGMYYGISAEANSKWTTIVHITKKPEKVLPRTGK